MIECVRPVLRAQVTCFEHVGVNLAGLVHALFEARDSRILNFVAALTVGTAVVQPGEHDRDEDGSDDHDEGAEGDGEEGREGQATRERAGLLDDAEGCRPIVRKIPLSKTRVMVCQFCWEKRLLFAEITAARRRETTRPATTAATRPDLPGARRGSTR